VTCLDVAVSAACMIVLRRGLVVLAQVMGCCQLRACDAPAACRRTPAFAAIPMGSPWMSMEALRVRRTGPLIIPLSVERGARRRRRGGLGREKRY
jgi:hypothetical protein